jgi:hypothetical protein
MNVGFSSLDSDHKISFWNILVYGWLGLKMVYTSKIVCI